MVDVALATLIERLSLLHTQTQQAAVTKASYQLTWRNWLIGRHLTEGEQPSTDHVVADSLLVTELAHHLRAVPGLSAPQLTRCQDFYHVYPRPG